jgi:hypothetical protein
VQEVKAHKDGISRASLQRLLNVNKAMNATRTVHHSFNDYFQNGRKDGRDYAATLWDDVDFLVEQFNTHIGSTMRALRQPKTYNDFSCRGMRRETTAASKLQNEFDKLPAWLEYLKSTNIVFDEPDVEAVVRDMQADNAAADEEPSADAEDGADAEVAPSRLPAASKWCNTHPPRNGESAEEQSTQTNALMARSARHRILWEKQQARQAVEAHEAELEAERVAVRAVARSNRDWEVDKIINRREHGGVLQYRVKWKGYASQHNTWEPAENLSSARRAMAMYEKQFKNKK